MTSFRARPLTLGIFVYLSGMLALTMSECYELILPLSVGLFALSALLAAGMAARRTAKRGFTCPLLLSVAFLLLFFHSLWYCHAHLFPALSLRGGTHTVQGTVERVQMDGSLIVCVDNGPKLFLVPDEEPSNPSPPQADQRLYLSFTADKNLKDPDGQCKAEGILVTGSWKRYSLLETLEAPPSAWDQLRELLRTRLSSLRHADLASAVVLGDDSGADPALRQALSATQMQHLLCVSGLHVSVLLWGVSRLLELLSLSRGKRTLILCAVCLFYVALMNFSPSVCRAAFMSISARTAGVLRKNNDSLTSLFFSAALLTLASPFVLYDLSFQLSFLATLGLVHVFVPWAQRVEKWRFFRGKTSPFPLFLAKGLLKEALLSLLLCFSAVAFSLPVLLKLTDGVNLWAFFSNFLLIVLFTPVLIASSLFLVLSLLLGGLSLPWLIAPLSRLCDAFLSLFARAVQALQATSQTLSVTDEDSLGLAFALCVLLLLAVFLVHDSQPRLKVCLLCLLFCLLQGIRHFSQSHRIARLSFLTHPAQQALLIQTAEDSLLYLPYGLQEETTLSQALALQGVDRLKTAILPTEEGLRETLFFLCEAYGLEQAFVPASATAAPCELSLFPLSSRGEEKLTGTLQWKTKTVGPARHLEVRAEGLSFSYLCGWDHALSPYTPSSQEVPELLVVTDSPFLRLTDNFAKSPLFCDALSGRILATNNALRQSLEGFEILKISLYPDSFSYTLDSLKD